MRVLLTIATCAAFLLAACGGEAATNQGTREVRGSVVAVQGDLTAVASFEVLTGDGDVLEFRPKAGLLFGDDEPIGHLRDHMTSGHPVLVRYEESADGLIAVYAGDAG